MLLPYLPVTRALDCGPSSPRVHVEDMAKQLEAMSKREVHRAMRMDKSQRNKAVIDIYKAKMDDVGNEGDTFTACRSKCAGRFDRVVGRERLPTWTDHVHMPLTMATIWEMYRWKACTPFGIPRGVAEDTVIGGYHVPKGTVLLPNFWAMHQSTELWKEPEKFDPSRFIGPDGIAPSIRPTHIITFSLGCGWTRTPVFRHCCRLPGSVDDSRIFDNSRLRVLYEENRVPGVLLGDAGYACQPYLFTPFSEPGPTDTPKGRYQKAEIKTRNVVERAFGVWKRRFPCLDMGMQHKAKNIMHIITACAALHNLACLLREPEPPAQTVPQPSPISTVATRTVHLPPVDRLTDSRSENQARDLLIRKSFT
ncbi:hypothetical protein MRX96_029702 [Rhipicephalus microplus]